MTKANAKAATQNVVIPSSVVLAALAIVSIAVKVWAEGAAKPTEPGALTEFRAAQAEWERRARQDRDEILKMLTDMRNDILRIHGDVERIKGKMER